MARKTPEEITRKFQQGMSAAGPAYDFGIRNPRRTWEEGASQAGGAWAAGVQQAVSENRYPQGVSGKQDKYNRKTQGVGVQRYSAAATVAAEEYARVASRIVQITGESSERARSMPGDTFEQRLQRMVENARYIRDAWRRGG